MRLKYTLAYSADPQGQRARQVIRYQLDIYEKPWTHDDWLKQQFRNEALTSIDELVPEIIDLLDDRGRPWSQSLKLSRRIKPFSLSRTVQAWPVAAWTMDLSWYRDDNETGRLHQASDAYSETYVFLLETGELVMSYLLHGSEPNKQIYTPPTGKKLVYEQKAPDKASRYWDGEFALHALYGLRDFRDALQNT